MKKKLQGLAEWGDLHTSVEINKCPKCGGSIENLHPLGFWLCVCRACKKFWSLKVVDVSAELTKKFKKEHL